MSEKKDKEDRKTIKEEMAEAKQRLVLTRNEDGSVKYEIGNVPAPQAVQMMRTVIDDLLIKAAIGATMQQLNAQMALAEKGLLKQ